MKLYLFDTEGIVTFDLPFKKIGDFWMTDYNDKNIVNIAAVNDKWVLSGSDNVKIIGYTESNNVILKPREYYLVEKNGKRILLFSSSGTDESFNNFKIVEDVPIILGRTPNCDIFVNSNYFQENHLSLTYNSGYWKLKIFPNSKVYINREAINISDVTAKNGDVIDIYGYKIILANGQLIMNNQFNNIIYSNKLEGINLTVLDKVTDEEIIDEKLYDDNDYFLKSPRMMQGITHFDISIDSPPEGEKIQDTPLWLTLAPMLTMAASSMITLITNITSVTSGEKTWKQVLPAIIICVAMILTMLVWPFVIKHFDKKQKMLKEQDRQEKYGAYLNKKKQEIIKELDFQKKTLENNLISTEVCYDMITNKRRTLWERRMDQIDFLTVRIGKGSVPFDATINYHVEDFSMEDDLLKRQLESVGNIFTDIKDAPIGYSLSENKLTAVSGIYPKYLNFVDNMLLQTMAFHGYDDLKIVVFTDKNKQKRWEYLKDSPYCFSTDKSIRFFGTNTEEMQEISDYLTNTFTGRSTLTKNGNKDERITDFSSFNCYYLILIDNIDMARKIEIIDNILSHKNNLGFSLLIMEEKLSKIPSEVTKLITIGDQASVVIDSNTANQIRFVDEINPNYDMYKCTKTLANLPLYLENQAKQMPDSISFLELYGVGQVEQLNVLQRWKQNNTSKSLKTEVGVNTNGDPFILDLHEKAHGPHGLIAGMTGSGKSEFIISYVLSMAINYSPEEVAFVLIDYKGGGLAGAFVNNETGERLPHVVGTITNLDKAEINRSLASINSELIRRQEMFNAARDKVGEGTIDIYKYQKLYREGIVTEPIPHLIIVSDEFAELKDQQPEFMDDLVSTARIGRSLGVHLILATQKPSGVVDAQIWSNSKFKICLKVQDKQDSMEMIKNDLAAELKQVGRFYLSVGYNEYFAMGQAAWAGAQYYPRKEYKKTADKNLYFIDNVGYINKSINNGISKRMLKSSGEELTNIIKYLISSSQNLKFNVRNLWLDRIPNEIYVNDLYKKYEFRKEKFNINPIIGEYDDPTYQRQDALTLPLTKEGNTIIYGSADSGKDDFLSNFVYSTIMTYDSLEVNFYLVDFGAETLVNFREAPQVGDIVLSSDTEKLDNLVKMLTIEIARRKKAFLPFNGNYVDYIAKSGKTMPSMIVVINSVETLNELYPDIIERISPIIRDGSKYGIHFVITTNSQSSVKFKIAQSCKQILCLQLAKETDYRDILGKTNGIIPSSSLGRGLIRIENRICEFQTAFIDVRENIFDNTKKLIGVLNEKGLKKALAIPTMPDVIENSSFNGKFTDLSKVPFGIVKETLTPTLNNFADNVTYLISSNTMKSMEQFMHNFIKVLESNNTFNKVVVDSNNFFEEFEYKMGFVGSNFNEYVDKLKTLDDKFQAILDANNRNVRVLKDQRNTLNIIVGFEKMFDRLDDEHKTMFKDILNHSREHLKINFVFVDIPSSFKKYEYEEWYKANVNGNNGLWIGPGIAQQFLIKTLSQPAAISNIDDAYGIYVKAGTPVIIKLLNEIKIKRN